MIGIEFPDHDSACGSLVGVGPEGARKGEEANKHERLLGVSPADAL
jgi:hypothetical protein